MPSATPKDTDSAAGAEKKTAAKKTTKKTTTAAKKKTVKKTAAAGEKKTAAKKTTTVAKKKTVKKAAEKAPKNTQRLRVRQVKSGIRHPWRMRRTLTALGLKHHQDEVVVPDNPSIRGMLQRVHHLISFTPEDTNG
jgi:large subunit ribosomal protein L30